MPGTNQPVNLEPDNPGYYTELLRTTRTTTHRCLSKEPCCPDIPGIQGADDPFARRLQTLLDVVADISLRDTRNVSATTASLSEDRLNEDRDVLETQLYIVFNRNDSEATRRCPQHLQSIFSMLSLVPFNSPSIDVPPKLIGNEFEDHIVRISKAIHNYSFERFVYRVNKRKDSLSIIRSSIERDLNHFKPEDRSKLLAFLQHLDLIINMVDEARDTKQLSTNSIRILSKIYSNWTKRNLLPTDAMADHQVTLLDDADMWLAENHGVGFQLRRWALKIMSFVISANRLFMLTQSRRLRKILDGKFSVRVLIPPPTTPYHCSLSPETITVALEAALAGTGYHTESWVKERASYIERLQNDLQPSDVVRLNPTVHAELAIIMALVKQDIKSVMPYIGASKLSCIMCRHYIDAFNAVMKQRITTKGAHGKAYGGWLWPSLPDLDRELRPVFLNGIRQHLLCDFMEYTRTSERARLNSDSSVESNFRITI